MDARAEEPLTVERAVERVRARNPQIRAFITTRLDEALAAREAAEASGGPLAGLPFGLKDLWDTAGIVSTGGSYRFRDRIPKVSAPVHRLFEAAGAVMLGKTNASDLGLAMESQSYVGGITANPHDMNRTAGGSSGGAAAAVADGQVAFDWGSDFGGSIRVPAGYCGVYGLRLSSEAWPLIGHFPVPPPPLLFMNGQGPITRDLRMMERVLDVVEPTMRTGPTRKFEPKGVYVYAPGPRTAGQWPTFVDDVVPALSRAVGDVRLDHGLPSAWKALQMACAMYSAHLSDYLDLDEFGLLDGLGAVLSSLLFRGRFGDRRFHPRTAEMLLLIALGRITLYRDKGRACRDATAYRAQVAALWDRGYMVAAPTTVFPAPRHGRTVTNPKLAVYSMPGNLVDATGLAVPFGAFPDGMPRSVQLWGPPGSERALIDVARRLFAD